MREQIQIYTDSIQLNQLLKWIGFSGTGGQGNQLIDEGLITLNGVVVFEKRKKIFPGDQVSINSKEYLIIRGKE